MVFIDPARFSNPGADLSVEPDILVLLVETIEAGRARLVPKASDAEGRFVEIEGTVDLAVECVSDASTVKDRKRIGVLPAGGQARGGLIGWRDGRFTGRSSSPRA